LPRRRLRFERALREQLSGPTLPKAEESGVVDRQDHIRTIRFDFIRAPRRIPFAEFSRHETRRQNARPSTMVELGHWFGVRDAPKSRVISPDGQEPGAVRAPHRIADGAVCIQHGLGLRPGWQRPKKGVAGALDQDMAPIWRNAGTRQRFTQSEDAFRFAVPGVPDDGGIVSRHANGARVIRAKEAVTDRPGVKQHLKGRGHCWKSEASRVW
jgi:hypothetical protein